MRRRDNKSRIILIMKILAIIGSARKKGNVELLLDKTLEAAKVTNPSIEVEKIYPYKINFLPCQECGGCDETGICIYKDDMQAVYAKINEADIIIVASPIFFGSLPAPIKALIDRHQCAWVAKEVLKKTKPKPKKGVLLLVEASEKESFLKNAESIIRNFFAVNDIVFSECLYCSGVDKKGEILERPECIEKALELAKRVLENKG